MTWYIPLAVTFAVIFLAELGDKTQLITISFASKYPHVPVFFGVFLGVSMITLLGVIVGTALFEFIPIFYVKILAGEIFVLFGVWTLYVMKMEEGVNEKVEADKKNIAFTTFIMISLAEFGDKTQFAVIALTVQYGAPIIVFIGAVLAFALVVGIGVFLGKKLSEKVSSKWIELGSALLFVIIGLIFIAEALLF
jgi:putative Ca2+/H+ antiporter (TMEM165/GDT1 family)